MQWVRALSLHQARNLALIVFEITWTPWAIAQAGPARPGPASTHIPVNTVCGASFCAGLGRAEPGRAGPAYVMALGVQL